MTRRENSVEFTLNGQPVAVTVDRAVPLLYVLRNDFCLNGPKYGCGLGECGACTILIDDKPARACVERLAAAEKRCVTTLEGLGGGDGPGTVQQAFIAEQGAQCGYCLNGMILTAHALLKVTPDPDDHMIAQALRYNLCRCGTHVEIVNAVRRAAKTLRELQEVE